MLEFTSHARGRPSLASAITFAGSSYSFPVNPHSNEALPSPIPVFYDVHCQLCSVLTIFVSQLYLEETLPSVFP